MLYGHAHVPGYDARESVMIACLISASVFVFSAYAAIISEVAAIRSEHAARARQDGTAAKRTAHALSLVMAIMVSSSRVPVMSTLVTRSATTRVQPTVRCRVVRARIARA